jgi:hypothetical protein
MIRVNVALAVVLTAVPLASCMGQKVPPQMQATPPSPEASLWQAPKDLKSRDLYHGPWGVDNAPLPAATYKFVDRKRTGVNPGMTVVDPQGREWSVKQSFPGAADQEGPSEVAVSRLLSAIGYHQPPVYYLPTFTLEDEWGTHTERGGRFRLKEKSLEDTGPWAWYENPFVGSKPFKGLLALLMMINSTDLKDSNNTLYERRIGERTEKWFVVRDVGASLGDTHPWAPLKGDSLAFERQPFVLGVANGHVDFAYKGRYSHLVRGRIAPEDVAWVADLLSQLTDRQWQDAFRAGGFEREAADRFIRKMKEKISEGRTLARRAAAE